MSKGYVLLLAVLLAACSEDRGPRKIVLIPIGPVPADVLAQLQRELPPIVMGEVSIGREIPLPAAAFDKARQQYRGSALLAELRRHDIADAHRIVGIIDGDAYAPGLNFIFGQAMNPGRFAVVALPRLRESFRARPEDIVRFRERAIKVTAHEVGHTFKLAHCPERTCVMHFANSVGELDRSGSQYCSREQLVR